MNLLRRRKSADYVNTGQWSKKAIGEAKRYCKVNVAASSEEHELHVRAAAGRVEARPAKPRMSTSPQRNDRRRRVSLDSRDGRRAAGSGCVFAHPVAPDGCRDVTASSTPVRRRTSARPGSRIVIVRDDLIGKRAAGHAFGVRLQGAGGRTIRCSTRRRLIAIYIAGLVFKWLKKHGRACEDGRAATSPRRSCCTTSSTRLSSIIRPVAKEDRSLHEHAVHACATTRSTKRF